MIANIGFGALVVAFLVSIYGIGAAVYGSLKKRAAWVESARLAMLLTFPLLTLVAISIITLLVNRNYEVAYVSEVTSNSMPFYLKVTALWGGQSGSLIFWSFLMSAFASAVTLRNWKRAQWRPRMIDRSGYDDWARSGRKGMASRANERARNILAEHEVVPLPEAAEREIAHVLASRQAARR